MGTDDGASMEGSSVSDVVGMSFSVELAAAAEATGGPEAPAPASDGRVPTATIGRSGLVAAPPLEDGVLRMDLREDVRLLAGDEWGITALIRRLEASLDGYLVTGPELMVAYPLSAPDSGASTWNMPPRVLPVSRA